MVAPVQCQLAICAYKIRVALHHEMRSKFVHIVLLIPNPEEVQQRLVSCHPRAVVVSGPLLICWSLGFHSNWLLAYLPAYVTPSLQFLTRTLELGAHHPGARLSTISCESARLSRPRSTRRAFRPSPYAPPAIVSQRHLQTALSTLHTAY